VEVIIDFFEYTLSGWIYFIYFIIMMIFSFACLGVVGEKVSKKRHNELLAKREAAAMEEYKKAKELIEKQANSYGVDNTLDPAAKKALEQTSNKTSNPNPVSNVIDNTSEDAISGDVPSVLVINEDGTSNES